ncbi:DUF559 domain-containing protein [Specibacter sp. RAF43]|uniref:DUF559 domain-containing protein n=1 Tax=Specibacter sp. RAF43 TaxID=3233057 RepID=UPI003F9CC440
MREPAPLPLHLHLAQRPFTLEQARAAKVSRGRTRSPDLWTPSRGIRVPRDAVFSLLDRCRPHTAVTDSGVISHLTAARIHGLYLPSWCEGERPIDLSRPKGASAPLRKHVVGHRLDLGPSDVVVMGGVPVTSLPRTFLDLAPLLGLDALVAIGDQIVCEHDRHFGQRKLARVPLEALNTYIAAHRGGRGLKKLRQAMDLVRVGVDSPRETRLRLIIVRSGLPDFEPNLTLLDAAGCPVVCPDLVCKEYKTCAEYDGDHHFSAEQQAKDHDRDFITESLGWHQVKINKEDLRMGEAVVVTKIARMLVRGGWADPQNLAGRSLRGVLGVRKDFH